MNKILIKNGNLVSVSDGYLFDKKDILLVDGEIKEIADTINYEVEKVIDATDLIVSPGLIDIHAHVFKEGSFNGLDADVIGVNRGTTTILDAGSAGPENIEKFRETSVNKSETKVFLLMNISKEGLAYPKELDNINKIDSELFKKVYFDNKDLVVGMKARASSSVCGDLGITPIEIATRTAHELEIPIMIHTGNFPPYIEEVLNLMEKDDVLTHAFHGKDGGILSEPPAIIEEALKARSRGVKFDIGHGSESFSFKTFEKTQKLGFHADFVSTDLHCRNYIEPVYSQHAVISKLLNMGEKIEDLIDKATSKPADHFKLPKIGHLKVGYLGDISISTLESVNKDVEDSMGNKLNIKEEFRPVFTIYSKKNEIKYIKHGDL